MYKLARRSANFITTINAYTSIRLCSQSKVKSSRTVTTKNVVQDGHVEEDEGPIRYTESPAYKWQAKASRTGLVVSRLWYEPYVILGSIIVFMVYFCILREENGIDEELSKTLYSRIHGLEEYQLHASLAHNKAHGKDTSDIEARLKELSKA